MWRVMFLHSPSGKYCHACHSETLDDALEYTKWVYRDGGNYDWPNMYFVVSEEEYQSYWKNVVS